MHNTAVETLLSIKQPRTPALKGTFLHATSQTEAPSTEVLTGRREQGTHSAAPLSRCAKRMADAAPMPTPASWPIVLSMEPSGSARLAWPRGSPNTCADHITFPSKHAAKRLSIVSLAICIDTWIVVPHVECLVSRLACTAHEIQICRYMHHNLCWKQVHIPVQRKAQQKRGGPLTPSMAQNMHGSTTCQKFLWFY